MNEQVRGTAPPEEADEVVTCHREVKRYRRGRLIPSQANSTEVLVAVHPAGAKGVDPTSSARPSLRSWRTWVTVLGAAGILLGTAITTGYVAMQNDPAFGSPEQVVPGRVSTPARVGPPVFIPTRPSKITAATPPSKATSPTRPSAVRPSR